MKRKKYRITIKMIKETTMDHEHESIEKALEDVKLVVENSTKDSLNQIFSSKPKFIYKVEMIQVVSMSCYDIDELENKIKTCKNLSINEVDIDKLDELSEIKISKKKKGNERILEFIKNISNPYIFKVKDKIVKIEFTNNGVSAEDSITNIVSNIYR